MIKITSANVRAYCQEELKAATKEAKTMALLVKRNDARIFVPVELG